MEGKSGVGRGTDEKWREGEEGKTEGKSKGGKRKGEEKKVENQPTKGKRKEAEKYVKIRERDRHNIVDGE